MPRKISRSSLNASTIDILNVIRTNASYQYQQQVPAVTTENDIPQVGAVIYGNPALSNEFINALINRIAIVAVRSAVFNNPYAGLKKGYLEFGETIENVFVEIVKAMDYSQEKAESRELKRYLPKVHSVFHVKNYDVLYPITIQDEDLKKAFLTVDGVSDMIARIIDSVYTGAQYDEYLITKYEIIKAVTSGKMYPQGVDFTSMDNAAVAFRAMSNKMRFMSSLYNEAGVPNTTPIDRQVIFMDADFNARFDVETLSGAFNMSKADFIGSLYLVDSFSTFDNDRFDIIRGESTQMEEVTAAELALMENVKAILVDEVWFQLYDNLDKMTEKYVAAGDRWNYFYHVQKTVSHSPFHNAVVFVDDSATITAPASFTVDLGRINNVSNWTTPVDTDTFILTMAPVSAASLASQGVQFTMTSDQVAHAVAISPEGSVMLGKEALTWLKTASAANCAIHAKIGDVTYTSAAVSSANLLTPATLQGATATWTFEQDP